MTIRTITESEARAILSDDEAAFLPFRIINDSGRAVVAQFVNAHAAEPERQNMTAWDSDAEQAANNATVDESIVIEMGRQYTASGNPVTLVMEPSHFDWTISE